jgi:hypothetical protein
MVGVPSATGACELKGNSLAGGAVLGGPASAEAGSRVVGGISIVFSFCDHVNVSSVTFSRVFPFGRGVDVIKSASENSTSLISMDASVSVSSRISSTCVWCEVEVSASFDCSWTPLANALPFGLIPALERKVVLVGLT